MDKFLLTISVTVCGLVASYLPVWFQFGSALGGWSILLGTLGSLAGIWLWSRFLRFD